MIRGFIVELNPDGTTTSKWAPSNSPVNVHRSRVALRVPPPPWNLVEGDTLNLLVPKVSGSGETMRTISFIGAVPTTPQQLVDSINRRNFGNIEARLDFGGGVSIHAMSTTPFIQVRACGTTVIDKFSLHTEVVAPYSHWEWLAAVDPIIGDQSEYTTFTDRYGIETDFYRVEDTLDNRRTCFMSPVASMGPMSTIEGTLCGLNGASYRGTLIRAHTVPPSEPETSDVSDMMVPPGWPCNILRPLDALPVWGADTTYTTGANRGQLWHSVLTDVNGFFSIPCARGQRVWLEIGELGWSAIIDVPDSPCVDIATLSSWRRTGMMGPID